jgi:hypothetical protein
MKCAKANSFGTLADRFQNAMLHLASGFVGKCESENTFGGELRIGFKKIPDALGNDSGLTGAGTRDYEQRTFAMIDRGLLLFVQAELFPVLIGKEI